VAEVELVHLTKVYGNDVVAVRDLNLQIGEGEFVVLVGPSGCGKTTALRMVAGLEEISAGEIRIGGKVVNDLPPRSRDIAMVFQTYALYPHKSVYDNLAFGLRMRKVPKEEQKRRVEEIARVLGLGDMLQRRPAQLSGGQRQRVAMGRAIVREPKAFLMDEPLSNLDAKLRVQMRAEIARIQKALKVTTVYVTHDQVEAMTMGDRVAVLKDGVLQQCDAPGTLYHQPDNLFVAGFIGSPAMNLVDVGDTAPLNIGNTSLTLHGPGEAALGNGAGRITVGFRPEALRVDPGGPLKAHIRTVEDLGPEVFVHVAIDHHGESLALVSKMQPPFAGDPGDEVGLQIVGSTHVFRGDGSRIASATATLN
jgi:multiple sugar transport system ATP-binding protein